MKHLVFFQIFVNSLGESAENQVFRVRKPSVQKNKCFVCVYAGNKSSVNTPSGVTSFLAQTCKLVLGSWTKTGWELDIVNINGENVTAVDKYVTSCINMREALFICLSLSNAALV